MLISAERYAFGRRSYIVSTTTNYLYSLLPHLSDWCIGVILQDLNSEVERATRIEKWDYWGDDCDKQEWLALLDALKAEKKRRDAE